jgi:hypothetical protein
MKSAGRNLLLWIYLFGGIGVLWGTGTELTHWNKMRDFRAVYSASRCLLHHRDAYNFDTLHAEYLAEGGTEPKTARDLRVLHEGMLRCVNLPTALFLIIPLAALPWWLAHLIWAVLIVASSLLAAFWVASESALYADRPTFILISIWLIGLGDVMLVGNLAGMVVSLSVLGAWLLLNEKYPWFAVACLATALLLKPHDAGFVWLFFLISPGPFRKRALQALALVAVAAASSVIWIYLTAPGWARELSANLHRLSGPGGFNDPGGHDASLIASLQAAVSAYKNDPHFYNPVSWIVSGGLLVLLLIKIARTSFTRRSAWMALASLAALSILPVYHRFYDARILLLSLPACALIWRDRRWKWTALVLTIFGMVTTADLSHVVLVGALGEMRAQLLLKQLAPLSLLALGVFYLCAYWRETEQGEGSAHQRLVCEETQAAGV